jgi:hypothetical protein
MKDAIIIQPIISAKIIKKKILKISLKKILIKCADLISLTERMMQQMIMII